MTDQYQADSSQVTGLLAQLPASAILDSVTADGAYDKRHVYRSVYERGAELITPPCKNAQCFKDNTDWANSRNNKLTAIKRLGRAIWKRWSGYHHRNLIETAMHRFKRLSEHLHGRKPAQQAAKVYVRGANLNRWVQLHRPSLITIMMARVCCNSHLNYATKP